MGGALKNRIAVAVVVLTLALHVVSVVSHITRGPSVDEIEYLHAAWLMAQGGSLYQTFFEHHSPVLFALFEPLAPGELADPLPYVMRARALAGAAGLAVFLLIAAVTWRFSPAASAIAVSLLYAADWIWLNGFADVRAEPFGMALMWGAVALLVLPRRESAVFPGLAMGLMSLAALLSPKWPIVTLVLTVVAFAKLLRMGWRSVLGGIAIASGFFAAGAAVLLSLARPGDWWFYTFPFNVALARFTSESPGVHLFFEQFGKFSRLPWFARPAFVPFTAAVAIGAFWKDRRRFVPVMLAAAVAAALIENRFLHSYPHLWPQYFALPSTFAAAVGGIAVEGFERWLGPRVRAIRLVPILAVLLCGLIAVLNSLPWEQTASPYWETERRVRLRMRPGETVWVPLIDHPITARDSHYYWFSPASLMQCVKVLDPSRVHDADQFPVCAAAAGRNPSMRFVSEFHALGMPGEVRCLQQLLATGKIRPMPGKGMYEVLR